VLLLCGMALLWHQLLDCALAGAVVVCALTLRLASHRLRALGEQALAREHDSLFDPVTELPGRLLFHQQAMALLAGGARRGTLTAVMLLDLDRFKEVNDTLGHHQGDLLLCEVANRLQTTLRASDLIARLGGDEFAVMAVDLDSTEHCRLLAQRLREALGATIELAGVSLEVEASVGIAVCSDHFCDSEDLLGQADIAMYQAKRLRTGIEFHNPEGDESRREGLELLSGLRQAIAAGELVVHYQPKADTSSAAVIGFEALVRWQHPTHGLLYPDRFMPLAENTGLMRPLTSFVLDQALAQCRAWREAGHEGITVAVNISTRNVLDEGLPAEVAERLQAHGLPGSALELEITETTLMADPVRAKTVIDGLAALGVRLAIDDFGTGYTSLAWLADLPVATLKIDKSFVMSMTTQHENAAIVRSTVQIGANLGLSVVAEGVEDEESWCALNELGCDFVQGFYLSKPKPPEAFDRWLEDRRAEAHV